MEVVVYEKENCMQCRQSKLLLNRLGIPYTTIDIEHDADALQYVLNLGYMAAPVITVSDGTNIKHWSGFIPDNIKGIKL